MKWRVNHARKTATIITAIGILLAVTLSQPQGTTKIRPRLMENSNVASPAASPWWSNSTTVTQQWGCTTNTLEGTYIPSGYSCPNGVTHWHHGIDLADSSGQQAVNCQAPTTGLSPGAGYTIYAGRNGTVTKVDVPVPEQYDHPSDFQFQMSDGDFANLLHVQSVLSGLKVGSPVLIGEALATVGDAGWPDYATACHLHFEIDQTGTIGDDGGHDVDPTQWLVAVPPPPSQAGPVTGAFNGASELIVAPASGSNAGMKLARNDTTNPYGWSSFHPFYPAGVTFAGTPTAIAYSNYVVVFAIGSDGALWNWYYAQTGCPSGWCNPHSLGGQLSLSSGLAAVSHTNILQVFAIGSNGSLQEYADSSPTCSNGSLYPAYNSWCNPAPIPGATTPLSLTSRVAVTEYAGYMQVFAVDVNGAMEHYAGACQGNDGWCTPYPLSNIGILTLSTSSGVAVVAYSGYMQLFALSYSGYLEEFSGACTPPPGQPYKVFCGGGALPGVLLSTNSGVAALVFGTHMQVFAIEPNGLLDEYSGACPPGPNGYQGWCPPFNNGGQLKPASDIGEMIWNGSMQVFAVGSDSSVQYWSGTAPNCQAGAGSNGWCLPVSLGSTFSQV